MAKTKKTKKPINAMEKENKELENSSLVISKKKIFWAILFLLIALLSIYAIVSFNKSFSIKNFISFINKLSPIYLILSIIFVFLYIMFEGLSITTISKSFGYKSTIKESFTYSAADIYFSAITPSATGGQPASAYFMYKDKIKPSIITLSLLYTLLMYSISIIFINVIMFIIKPSIFVKFSTLSKILILIGFITQIGLIILFYTLLYKEKVLIKLSNIFINLLTKLHIIRDKEKYIEKISKTMVKYKETSLMIKNKKGVLIKSFIFNLCQRISQIMIIIFVFLGTGGPPRLIDSVFAVETFTILGSYSIPIPGAIGVTDYLMLNGFKNIMPAKHAVNLELLSRGISFYCCIIICGLVVILKYILIKRSSKK